MGPKLEESHLSNSCIEKYILIRSLVSCIQHIQQIPTYKKRNQEPVLAQMSKHALIWKYSAAAAAAAALQRNFFHGFFWEFATFFAF